MFKKETLVALTAGLRRAQSSRRKMHERTVGFCLVLLILMFSCTGRAYAEDAQRQVRIGVQADRGHHECFEKLSIGPFKDFGKVVLGQTIGNYWYWLIVIAAMVAMTAATVYVLILNRRLHQTQSDPKNELIEHKHTEEELRSSELKFRTLYEATGDAVMLIDEKGFFFDCNDATLRIFGIADKEEFCRSHPSDLSPPEQPSGISSIEYANNNIAKAMQDGSYRFEHMHRRKDGTDFPAEVLLNRMKLGNRTVLQAVVRDISERKRAEEDMQAASQYTRSLIEASLDPLVTISPKGKITDVNRATEIVTGVSRAGLIGSDFSDYFTDPLKASAGYQQVFSDGAVSDYPLTIRHTSGRETDVLYNASVYRNEAGEVQGVFAAARDITDRKRAEEELRRAKEVAEAATNAKSGFLANMSHEIRTPMTAILGYTDLMMDSRQDASERLNCLAVIRRNGEHLLTLINDILDISRIEAGKFTIEKRSCSIPAVVAEVTSTMRVRADERGISLTAEYAGKLPETILTDQARLRQGLINLVGNAVKFTETGGVRLNISFLPEWRDSQPAVRIEVEDTGIGIAPDDLKRLFQSFVQVDSSASRKYKGTGLGLAITRHIVELMGGELTAKSAPGKGSTFTITIPTGDLKGVRMLDRPDEAIVADGQSAGPSDFSSNSLSGKRILLAEDGEDNMRLIRAILRNAGAEVAAAENGRIAVDMAMREPFDVILMDMQMPVMDGYQAASYLRSLGYAGPIIALIAHAMAEDRERCISAGCDDYLTKPIDRVQLIAGIARRLGVDADGGGKPAGPAEAARFEVAIRHGGTRLWQDDEAMRSELADDPDLAEVIGRFVTGLSGQIEAMHEAASNGHYERLRRLAHQLKGAGGSYGYPLLTTAARTLEDAAKAGDIEAANLAINRLTGLCRAIVRGRDGSRVGGSNK